MAIYVILVIKYIRCEMTPTFIGGEQQGCRGHSWM